jgi:hypothetical protein
MPKTSRYIADYLRERTVLLQDRGSSLSPPILLGLTRHGGRFWVLHLNPMRRAPRPIRRAKPFRHNALAAEPARLAENDVAVFFEMLFLARGIQL